MARRSSVDHTTMHQMNLALILNTLRLYAPISRVTLAAKTGLHKATVSSMVKTLLQHRFIREMSANHQDTVDASVGRPAINLELNPDAGYIIGVEIGVDFLTIVLTNFALEIVERRSLPMPVGLSAEDLLPRLLDALHEVISQVNRRSRPLFGIGIGVPGLVDIGSGTLLFAPNLNWRDVPLQDMLCEALDYPVFLANEANLAALGESYFGAGRHCDSVLYVSSGTGLGGGIVMNDSLLSGTAGFAGEIGHMMVDPDGLACNCGNTGCWETVATQRAVFRHVRQAAEEGRGTLLYDRVGGDWRKLTISLVVEAARNGDLIANEALEDVGHWLGIGIANLINVINPQRVVFGGPLSMAHEILLPHIKAAVASQALQWIANTAEIVVAAHVADAAVMGGVAIVHQEIVSNPLNWLP
jgi:glucokinase-like ROK family protein